MKLRVGIAGYGRSGYGIHTKWLREVQRRFKIVAVADQLPERRKDAEDEWNCNVYDDYKKLLKAEKGNLDLFINALPSHLHVQGTVDAFRTGFPVVCEKPLGSSVKEFNRMVAAAEKAGLPFMPFQNSRFYSFFQKTQQVIESGVLGEIVHIRSCWGAFARRWDWQTLQKYKGGNLLNTGPHPMDHAVCFLKGAMPKVCCQMKSIQPFGGDAEDYCNVTLYGKDLPTVEVVLSSYQAYPGPMCNVHGTLGGLSGGPDALEWRYFDPEKAPKQKLWEPWSLDRGYCGEKLPWVKKKWKVSKRDADSFQANCRRFYKNVYDVLVNDADPVIQLSEVRTQIAIIEECHKQNPLPKRVS